MATAARHCLACGGLVEHPLAQLGSLRCQDCRDEGRVLDPVLCNGAERRSVTLLAVRLRRRLQRRPPARGNDNLFP